jgi:hypothetical protein
MVSDSEAGPTVDHKPIEYMTIPDGNGDTHFHWRYTNRHLAQYQKRWRTYTTNDVKTGIFSLIDRLVGGGHLKQGVKVTVTDKLDSHLRPTVGEIEGIEYEFPPAGPEDQWNTEALWHGTRIRSLLEIVYNTGINASCIPFKHEFTDPGVYTSPVFTYAYDYATAFRVFGKGECEHIPRGRGDPALYKKLISDCDTNYERYQRVMLRLVTRKGSRPSKVRGLRKDQHVYRADDLRVTHLLLILNGPFNEHMFRAGNYRYTAGATDEHGNPHKYRCLENMQRDLPIRKDCKPVPEGD